MSKIKLGWPVVLAVLLAQGALLLGPDLLRGAGLTHSYVYNSTWVLEFGRALESGQFPPRWLHGAFNGMGAPSFYFYPPLFFYAAALVDLVIPGSNHMTIIAWTTLALTVGSGLTMFAWLRSKAGDAWALIGAVIYLLAPYHLLNLYVRGSVGETMGYLTLPLLALGLERAARSWAWIPALALGVAALLTSHLLIALLAGVSILPVYALYLVASAPAGQRGAALLRCAVGGLLGLAIALAYLGPAMTLQDDTVMHIMWGKDADPSKWALLTPSSWPQKPFSTAMAWITYGLAAAALAAVAGVVGRQRSPPRDEALVWSLGALVAFALYAMPWVWQGVTGLVLNKVQFPFRLLLGMEFAAVTALVLAAAHGRVLLVAALALASVVPMSIGYRINDDFIRLHNAVVGDAALPETAAQVACRRAPEEHLPHGFASAWRYSADPYCMSHYQALPLAAPETDGARVTAASVFPDGSVAMAIEAARPTRIVLRKFYFPTWEVGRVEKGPDPVVATEPATPEHLLSFTAEPGAHLYRARIVRSPLEVVCDTISLLALAATAAWLGLSLRRRHKASGDVPARRAFMRIRTR